MQQTLAGSFTLCGVGIHTGAQGRITVHPADADSGRAFRVGNVTIPAQAEFVLDTSRCTTLGKEGAKVSTIEHLLSALHGLNVDNALIEVEGPEIPILDGSAVSFVEAIRNAGIVAQAKPPRIVTLESGFIIEEGSSRVAVTPGDVFALTVETAFDHWAEGTASVTLSVSYSDASAKEYAEQIAPARTFAFRHEVEMLIAAGLAKGGSLENALIISPPDAFSTPLRLPAEWCRHKVLDIVGDLALVDARLQFGVLAERTGHRLNVRLAQEIRARAGSFAGY